MTLDAPLRAARRAAGLSQAELAASAGISRQAVSAIEAGTHRPGVDAAIALARAVDRSVEELFSRDEAKSRSVLAGDESDGAVLAARVGGKMVHASADRALTFEGWPRANGVLRDGRLSALPGDSLDGFVVVGCDPALGLAAALLPSDGPHRVIAISGSTTTALDALAGGRAHAALVHGPVETLPEAPDGGLRLHVARWRVGVANRGRRSRSVAELCHRRARVVQRDAGASSQKAFLAAVDAEGGRRPSGPIASGHLEVARLVVHGAAAGVTMEPAAIHSGLAFSALEEHVVEVWIGPGWHEHPGATALGEVLRSAAFTSRLALVGGYELAGCGSNITRKDGM